MPNPSRRRATRLTGATAVLLFFAIAGRADAQIYSWRDADGHMVYSDRPQTGSPALVPLYAVSNAPTVRATTFVPAERSRPFDELIEEHARLNGIRPDLVRAVVQVESAFNPEARSPKGAMGLMQLMPATARQFGVNDPFDPRENVSAGVRYLRQLLDRYGNDERLALAAYNAGPGAVDKHGQNVPPYRETREYVAKVDKIAGPARPLPVKGTRIFRITEVIDGREVTRYTDRPQ